MRITPITDFNRLNGVPVRGYTAAAAQAAVDQVIAQGGGTVLMPAGLHTWNSPVVVDLSAGTGLWGKTVVNFVGPGSSCRISHTLNSSTALSFLGGEDWLAGGPQLHTRIGGFRLSGQTPDPANAREGIFLDKVIGAEFFDLNVLECNQALRLRDTVITRFYSCLFDYNNYGIIGLPGAGLGTNEGSPANEMAFVGTHFVNNRQNAIDLDRSNNISFLGGSFENNGLTGAWTSDTDRWAIRIRNGGYNGGAVLGLYGTHFEGNTGTASVWIDHDDLPGVYNIDADFVRNGSHYATNEILFNTTGTAKAVVNVRSSFQSVNGYTPNAARRYIAQGTVSGSLHRINYLGSLFESATEMPSFGDQSLVPPVGSLTDIGAAANRFLNVFTDNIYLGSGVQSVRAGNGSPEGAVNANPGSLYLRGDGSAGSRMYFKTGAGFNATGWTALTTP